MHFLQPKHLKLNEKETEEVLKKLNISRSQLPKIFISDSALPDKSEVGDVIKIERTDSDGKTGIYYRVVV